MIRINLDTDVIMLFDDEAQKRELVREILEHKKTNPDCKSMKCKITGEVDSMALYKDETQEIDIVSIGQAHEIPDSAMDHMA
ncbi:hypothetical protein [Heyndrickxia acidicola]|uniref:Uncharacterized protein n=1 Tax=Heyndrickxia acidicola TaxID=209389 RepID=A0ABU6MQ24_9BACI|nr:hypothetical protein [Heyndrickxia acidicola]MED1205723.1 hypothetical protein [Heyndrickxia acidicola]